jgi:uncharacterized membrane-anchored protein YitT (DUF2179 family)
MGSIIKLGKSRLKEGPSKMERKIVNVLYLNTGVALQAITIHFFLAPNQFAAGGLSGLTIVLHHFLPNISIGLLMAIFNIILFAIGFSFLGFQFGLKTIYSSFSLSFMVWLLDKVFNRSAPISHDMLIQLIIGLMIASLGVVIVLNQHASTGGTDMIAMILNKYFSIDVGKATLLSDFLIVVLSIVAFGYEKGLYALFGIFFRGVMIDYFMQQFSLKKEVVIISSKSNQIKNFILDKLGRGATVYEAKGAFSNDKKSVITIVVKRHEFPKLKKYIDQIDKQAFITVHTMIQVTGNGFKEVM